MNKKSIPYILLLGVLFGTTLVVSRFSVDQFAPTTYLGLRFTLVSFGFIIVYTLRIKKRRWPRGNDIWRRGFILGIFGTAFPMTGIVSSLEYLSSGLTSILITVGPAFTVLLAHFFLDDEPLNRRKLSGVLLALGGAMLLVILGESGLPDVRQANPVGYLLVLGGMFSGSMVTIYARKYMQKCDTFDATGIRMFIAALFVMPLSLFLEGFDLSQVNSQGVLALFFAAIAGSFLGYLLSLYNIQHFGATAAVMTSYVIPVVAGLVGALFLNERITWGMVAGISLIALGVGLINVNGRKKMIETYT